MSLLQASDFDGFLGPTNDSNQQLLPNTGLPSRTPYERPLRESYPTTAERFLCPMTRLPTNCCQARSLCRNYVCQETDLGLIRGHSRIHIESRFRLYSWCSTAPLFNLNGRFDCDTVPDSQQLNAKKLRKSLPQCHRRSVSARTVEDYILIASLINDAIRCP